MDKVKKYKKIVRTLIEDIADTFSRNSDWEILSALDDERGQYLLFTDGWKGEDRDYGCVIHVEVKSDGKVWLRRDGTDLDFGQQLLDEGIPKSHIVLAFHSPRRREWSDFAVA
jgi:hypothetical protein